jgi:hypothetical protein
MDGSLGPAQELVDRPPDRLAVDVPQRDVEGADADDRPAAAVPVKHTVVQLGPEALRRDWVLAEQLVAEKGVRSVQHGTGHARRDSKDLRETADPFVGVDTHERQRVDPLVGRSIGRRIPQDKHLGPRDLHA